MASQKILITPATASTFQASGGTVVWTPQNIALANGRISAVLDLGSSASVPRRFRWRMQTRWAATATALTDVLRLYLLTSNASATAAQTDGGQTFGDATVTTENGLIASQGYFGQVVSTGVSQIECASGEIYIDDRYVAVACWNASAAKALTNTAGDHIFTLAAIPDDLQAPA